MKREFLAVGLLTLALTSTSAAAQQACAARQSVIKRLADSYGESRQSIGIGPKGRVVEVYASTETGTWTITLTMPNGVTCLIASGQSFENLSEAPAPKGVKG